MDAKLQGYIDKLVELRSKKGMTPEQAKEILLNQYLYYGVMTVSYTHLTLPTKA